MSEDDRIERGRTLLGQIDSGSPQGVRDSLAGIAPDLPDMLFGFAFGDIYSRPGLALRDRQIATIAALAALGTARPQLEVHIRAGLNIGLTRTEISELLMQMAVYAGFPAALNGLAAAKAVFEREDAKGA